MKNTLLQNKRKQRPQTSIPIRFVNIKIKDSYQKQNKKIQQILEQVKPFLKNKDWNVYFQKQFQKSGIQNLLKILDVVLIQRLNFHFCKCSSIPKLLSDIKFSRLKSLCVPGNKIKSIEPLQRSNFCQLVFLELRQNYVVNIKSLTKVNWNKLSTLQISLPKMIQIDAIWLRGCFCLKTLWNYSCQNLQLDSQIIKNNFSNVQDFRITNCNKMFGKQVNLIKKIIKQKHNNIELFQSRKLQILN